MQIESTPQERLIAVEPAPLAARLGGVAVAIPRRLLGLIAAGLLLECVILVLVKGTTLRTWPDAIRTPTPITGIYGENVAGIVRFGATGLALFAAYGLALWFSRVRPSRATLAVAFLFPLLFALPLWIMYPAGSQDMMHNTFDAILLWQYRVSPLSTPPLVYPDHPLFSILSVWEDEASYYGPLWYLALAPTNAIGGNDFVANILAQKTLVGGFFFATAVMVYLIARRFRPEAVVPAVVFFAWNPLVLFETVGNGHNDILMIFFGMVGFWLTLSRRWFWVVVALTLAVLVKYVFVVLGPLLLVYALYQDGRQALRPLVLGGIVSCVLTVLVFAPFYEGRETFTSIFGGLQRWISSPSSLMNTTLTYALDDEAMAGTLTKRLTLGLFLVIYLWLLWRQGPSYQHLVSTSFYTLFFYLAIIGWWYWPWYLLWVLPFAALLIGERAAMLAFILSLTTFLNYIPVGWERFLWDPIFKFYGVELARTFMTWSAPLLFWVTIPLQRLRFGRDGAAVSLSADRDG